MAEWLDPVRVAKRQRRERMWVAGVVLYTVARFAIAWGTLRTYGLNVWIFGLLDIGTAPPYALATARLVTSMVDKRYKDATGWMLLAAVTFLAPYLYIAVAGRDRSLPLAVYVVLGLLVIGLGANAALAVRKRVRAAAQA